MAVISETLTRAPFLLQHRVPHPVLRVHWCQQLLGCDPSVPSAVGLSGAQRDRLVPGHHRCRHPRRVQGHGEQDSRQVTLQKERERKRS